MDRPDGFTAVSDVTGREWFKIELRACHHPAVAGKYGLGGKAVVEYAICQRCKWHEHDKHTGAIRCTYEGEQNGEG